LRGSAHARDYVWLAPDQQDRERVRTVPDELGAAADRQAAARRLLDRRDQGHGLFADAGRRAASARYDADVLCEEFIEGEEVTCPVLGTGASATALPVIRIVAPDGAYDYQNKYFTDDVTYQCPSGLPETEEREIQRIVLASYRALGCRGWGRADLMIRASDRKPFLLEMNTSPGMTGHSLVPMSARALASATKTCACACCSRPRWTTRPPRRGSQGMSAALPTPLDVRLMNATASALFVALAAAGAGSRPVVGACGTRCSRLRPSWCRAT
jgi:hypothetical protein